MSHARTPEGYEGEGITQGRRAPPSPPALPARTGLGRADKVAHALDAHEAPARGRDAEPLPDAHVTVYCCAHRVRHVVLADVDEEAQGVRRAAAPAAMAAALAHDVRCGRAPRVALDDRPQRLPHIHEVCNRPELEAHVRPQAPREVVGHLEVLLADDRDAREQALELAFELRDHLLGHSLGCCGGG